VLEWQPVEGFRVKEPKAEFRLEPGKPFVLPLRATVAAGRVDLAPKLTITFEPRFRNRTIEVWPFVLAGPEKVTVERTEKAPTVDGSLNPDAWRPAGDGYMLNGLPPLGGRADRVRLLHDQKRLYLAARLDDPRGDVTVKDGKELADGGRSILNGEHVALVLTDGKTTHTFAVSPERLRCHDSTGADEDAEWLAGLAADRGAWKVEMAVPLSLYGDWSMVRLNVVHRRKDGMVYREMHLRPSCIPATHPDNISDVVSFPVPERMAGVTLR